MLEDITTTRVSGERQLTPLILSSMLMLPRVSPREAPAPSLGGVNHGDKSFGGSWGRTCLSGRSGLEAVPHAQEPCNLGEPRAPP